MAKEVYGDHFDLTLETDSSVGTLTAGIHRARCKEAKVEQNKARDGHNLVLTMESMEKGQEGRTARTWLSLKETARWKLTEALQAFGAEAEADKSGSPKVRMTRATFVGKKVRIQIAMDDFNGEERASIERILPYDGKSTAGGPERTAAKKPSPLEEPDEPDVDDEEEEEEEVRPVRKSKKAKRRPEPEPEEDDDDEDEEYDEPLEEELPF